MPKVGGKHFGYDKKGREMARKEAKRKSTSRKRSQGRKRR